MADLLTVKDLRVRFKVHGGIVDAVKGASLTIRQGSTVALVGESGSGTVSYTHLTLPTKRIV